MNQHELRENLNTLWMNPNWASRSDTIKDILAEFERVVAERDKVMVALTRAEQTFRNLAFGFLDAEANTIAQNEAANIRAALSNAEGES